MEFTIITIPRCLGRWRFPSLYHVLALEVFPGESSVYILVLRTVCGKQIVHLLA